MTELLAIGQIPKAPNQLEVRRFELFHNSLCIIPFEQTAEALAAHQLETARSHLDTTLLPARQHVQISAMMRHILGAKAQIYLELENGTHTQEPVGLGWLESARSSLLSYLKQNDMSLDVLKRSIFFTEHYRVLSGLGKQAVRFTDPGGAYERYAFIAGVANGQLKTRFRSSSSLRRVAAKPRAA